MSKYVDYKASPRTQLAIQQATYTKHVDVIASHRSIILPCSI